MRDRHRVVTAMGVHGHEPGNEDDPFWTVGGTALDVAVLRAPVDKHRREDLQVWSFFSSLGASGHGLHPIGIVSGDDPPDRVVCFDGERRGLELTELTIEDVRRDLARIRQVGRTVEQALRTTTGFDHLTGRIVLVSAVRDDISGSPDSATGVLLTALAEERGCVGDGVDLSAGLPEQLPSSGFYGEHAGLVVQVYRGELTDAPPAVVATTQATFRRSEAIAALRDRIAAKDNAGTDLLLVTCGLIDARGYRCPADAFLFGALAEIAEAGDLQLPQPKHIASVVLHEWQSGGWFEALSDGSVSPWRSSA